MKQTIVEIKESDFYINGVKSYANRTFENCDISGMLFNSRMINAIFDDENPETCKHWVYPDTKKWDPMRNTVEFCKALKSYRDHGLLAVTVGLQGGGSCYTKGIYDQYLNSAFTPDGELKAPFMERLFMILEEADKLGMVVIVNYFYWVQMEKMSGWEALKHGTQQATKALLASGYRNILIDLYNEVNINMPNYIVNANNIAELIAIAQAPYGYDHRLLVGSSAISCNASNYTNSWLDIEDFTMPHGNSQTPETLSQKLDTLLAHELIQKRPRPILINEDSIFVENMLEATKKHVSWGFYCQGYGSDYADLFNWREHSRETEYENLSGYQTLPVNWSINTDRKRAFFNKVKEITGY